MTCKMWGIWFLILSWLLIFVFFFPFLKILLLPVFNFPKYTSHQIFRPQFFFLDNNIFINFNIPLFIFLPLLLYKYSILFWLLCFHITFFCLICFSFFLFSSFHFIFFFLILVVKSFFLQKRKTLKRILRI